MIRTPGCSPSTRSNCTAGCPPGFELQVGVTHSILHLPAISFYHSFSFLLKTSFLAVVNHCKVISVTVASILAKEPEEQRPALLTRSKEEPPGSVSLFSIERCPPRCADQGVGGLVSAPHQLRWQADAHSAHQEPRGEKLPSSPRSPLPTSNQFRLLLIQFSSS